MVSKTKYSELRFALSPTLVKAFGWEHQHTHTNTHEALDGKQVQINRKRKRQYKHLDGRQLIIKDY